MGKSMIVFLIRKRFSFREETSAADETSVGLCLQTRFIHSSTSSLHEYFHLMLLLMQSEYFYYLKPTVLLTFTFTVQHS